MRKIAYLETTDETKKIMIYESNEGVYLFGYDCLQDTSSFWDNWFETLEDAENFCIDKFSVNTNDWILISEPLKDCQHDFVSPTRIKGKNEGKPEWGHFQTLINDKWFDTYQSEKYLDFGGLSENERLLISGLLQEFDKAKLNDMTTANKILKALKLDNVTTE